MSSSSLDLTRTADALRTFDAFLDGHEPMLERCRTEAEVERWMAQEREAEDRVLAAFAEDTADRNSRTTIMQARPFAYVRELVGQWERGEL